MEVCKNCGRAIGNLETPHVYQGHIVCAACAAILDAPAKPEQSKPITISQLAWLAVAIIVLLFGLSQCNDAMRIRLHNQSQQQYP